VLPDPDPASIESKLNLLLHQPTELLTALLSKSLSILWCRVICMTIELIKNVSTRIYFFPLCFHICYSVLQRNFYEIVFFANIVYAIVVFTPSASKNK